MIRSLLVLALLSMAAGSSRAQDVHVLAPADLPAEARFGASLSLTQCGVPQGPGRLVAGAPRGQFGDQAAGAGQAFVYLSEDWSHARALPSPDPKPGDLFGHSVYSHCWEFHGYLVGAPGDDAAYHFNITTSPDQVYFTLLPQIAAA
jgi:hypothetical protein